MKCNIILDLNHDVNACDVEINHLEVDRKRTQIIVVEATIHNVLPSALMLKGVKAYGLMLSNHHFEVVKAYGLMLSNRHFEEVKPYGFML